LGLITVKFESDAADLFGFVILLGYWHEFLLSFGNFNIV